MSNIPLVIASEVLTAAHQNYETAHRISVEAERRLSEATVNLTNAQREFDRLVGPLRMKAPEQTPWHKGPVAAISNQREV